MTLIVGLGNPTKQYERTRHNAGFLAIDNMIDRVKPAAVAKSSFKGELFKAGDLLLLKPTTFMNLSGESVQAVQSYYKPEKTIVIHDDLDLPFGALRFKRGGSSGGHNGLKSIDAAIGADYLRVRMGIGRPSVCAATIDYVLGRWSSDEEAHLDDLVLAAATAALQLVTDPLEMVQTTRTLKGV
ncbi:peptidyl-tRNA hydrolase [Campylobacterota bacterium]|nr:peptidyl-tRNA hydrolase [Campylobacterota bacterium]